MLLEIPYQRENAVAYARKWALSRNPLFIDFTGQGGNCTNFTSQCVFAGCGVMNFTPTYGWYYLSASDRAPAWSGVDEFYRFATGQAEFAAANGGVGPYGVIARMRNQILAGDLIQLANEEGRFYHTLIISEIRGGEVLVCAQSDDALDRPLSTYRYADLRVIHLLGARIVTDYDLLARDVLDAVALPKPPVRGA